ncbi:MAG: DNA polymerase III subunit gamma/tau [Acidobacteria bacterium]|nr:DNA polymerase III subunit gamma/tau [Acidobacteriota bacterium]
MTETSAYVPLARKWRPRTFVDVVGQEEIVRALTSAVTADRLAHAYLFSGPRGVGKTTSARLLAAAINCSSFPKPTPTPCGTCASCLEVLEGRSIDALEIDGATHGKVDQARDLIEVVSYAPVRDRRKVLIIDEVHAISSAAFQALLKTLEEPPAHAVFILATTERHKIPATILSRCQRFDFRRLTDDEVADRLAEIARREGYAVAGEGRSGSLNVERAALASLAAAATGSLRDGLSLFDQAVARAVPEGPTAGGTVTAADVAALLGAPDRSALVALIEAVLASDRAEVLRGVARLDAAGADPRTTLHDLTSLVRGVVRLAADPKAAPPPGLSEDASAALVSLSKSTPYGSLLRILTLLLEGDGSVRRSDVPVLALEVLLLRLAEMPRLVAIEEILAGRLPLPSTGGSMSTAGSTANAGSSVSSAPAEAAVPPSAAPKAAPVPRPAAPAAPSAPAPAAEPAFEGLAPLDLTPDRPADPVATFRAAVDQAHTQLGAVLEDADVTVSGSIVTIRLHQADPKMAARLREPNMGKVLEKAAVSILGKAARVAIVIPEAAAPADVKKADPKAVAKAELTKEVESDAALRRVRDLFGAEVVDIKRDGGR